MEDKRQGSKNARPKRIGKNRRDNNRFVGDVNSERRNNQSYRNENIHSNIKVENFNTTSREDMIEGRNAVIEALKSDRTIEYIMIAQGDTKGSISVITALAKEKSVVVKYVDRAKLDGISETAAHQGVIAIVTPYNY